MDIQFSVDMTDHKEEVLKEAEKQILLGLQGIGVEAEGFAKMDCPVDTGRLRASINFATKEAVGTGIDQPYSQPNDLSVYVGTNVEYAEPVEFRDTAKHITGKAHFLRDSLANHGDRYKEILEAALKAGE